MMRDADEIQKAHDMVLLLLHESERQGQSGEAGHRLLKAAADVLCWVLRHDHSAKFAGILVDVETALGRLGITMARADRLFTLAGDKRAD